MGTTASPRGISDTTARALRIVRDHQIAFPKQFAEQMWPGSPAWRRSVRCGAYGSHTGGGMYRAAGALLGKLRHQGLLDWRMVNVAARSPERTFFLTTHGQQALAAWEAAEVPAEVPA